MQHIETFSEPDMLLHLHDDLIVDHRAAATLALQYHCKGDFEVALVWERLAVFLRISEAYIFDDEAGVRQPSRDLGSPFLQPSEKAVFGRDHKKSDRLCGPESQLVFS